MKSVVKKKYARAIADGIFFIGDQLERMASVADRLVTVAESYVDLKKREDDRA